MAEPVSRQNMSPNDLMIVIVIALGSFMAGLDATIVNIALPAIAKAFDVSTVMVSWVLNAYLIVLVSLLLAASRLGDMKGYRNLFLCGFALFTAGSALCGLSPTIDLLIVSRMVQAIGGAVIAALGAVMVTSYLPASLRGQALGLVAMFTMLGAALGPVVGGFLTSAFSWQYIFFCNLPVGIIAILLGMHILPRRDPVSPAAKLDIPGVLLVFIALSTLIVGLTSVQGSNAMAGMTAIVLSVLFWVLFIARERRAKEPLVNVSLFANRGYSLQNLNVMLIQMAMAGVMVVMPFYLELVKQIPADNAGTILLALPLGMILTAPPAGKISDVIGTKKPIIAGFAIVCIVPPPPLRHLRPDERRTRRDLPLPAWSRYRRGVLSPEQCRDGRVPGTGPRVHERSGEDDDQPRVIARGSGCHACRHDRSGTKTGRGLGSYDPLSGSRGSVRCRIPLLYGAGGRRHRADARGGGEGAHGQQ